MDRLCGRSNLKKIDSNRNPLLDNAGSLVVCDDAGDPGLCWGQSYNLSGSYVSRTQGRQLGGFGRDSMLALPLARGMENRFINLLMTSYEQSSFGDYLLAFHMGIGSPVSPEA